VSDHLADEARTAEVFKVFSTALATDAGVTMDTLTEADVYLSQMAAILVAALVFN
jgi:hypothetical protein